MPHIRARHISGVLKKSLNYSPIVGLFGHRQVGKTTLISALSKEYVTLDVRSSAELVEADAETFIDDRKAPFALDECQLAPALFPALKEHVRKHPKPGQFILSGSVRFSARKAIRESLVGRMIAWELLPMDLAELHEAPLSGTLRKIAFSKNIHFNLSLAPYCNPESLVQYLKYGGMPGFFSIRNESIRRQKIETQIEALLERDLRLLIETKLSFEVLRNLIAILANEQGEPFEINRIARKAQITVPTLTRLMLAFQAMYLLRLIPTEGGTKKKIIFFEDQGEASYFSSKSSGETFDLVRFLFANLRTQLNYQNDVRAEFSQYRTRSGAYVPLVVTMDQKKIGLIPMLEENPHQKLIGSATSFIKRHPEAKVLFVHMGKKDLDIHPSMRIMPIAGLL
jgi:predicted AAA+ superfamily ATPase